MSFCFSRCLRVPIAIRAFYESYLWILQTLLLTHPDLHPGLLGFMHQNYCRVHKTLRVTPAIEAGLTEHVTEIEALRRRSLHGMVGGMSLRSYCFDEAVLGSCAWRGFVLLAACAVLLEGLLTLLACCSCFWSFLPAVCLADTGFTCAVLA
jgi:hypothetical protein